MSEESRFREIVVRVVSEVFDAKARTLRDELIHQVLHEAEPLLAAAHRNVIQQLNATTAAMHQAQNQNEILLTLLEGVANFSGRAALLVTRGNSALGWQARGCAQNDAIRSVTLDLGSGMARNAVQQKSAVNGVPGEAEGPLRAVWGASESECAVLPLVVRDKVLALIYADGGTDAGKSADPALLILVRSAGACLELMAVRQAIRPPTTMGRTTEPAAVVSESPVIPPQAQTAAAQPQPVIAAQVVSAESSIAPAPNGTASAQVPQTEPAADFKPAASMDTDEELHRKARRFAKLLVDEIKLYNHAKVAEGKRNRDLYDRLKDDIDKSRTTYEKRYAQTVVAEANYFAKELIRNLADNNETLLGSNFPR